MLFSFGIYDLCHILGGDKKNTINLEHASCIRLCAQPPGSIGSEKFKMQVRGESEIPKYNLVTTFEEK